MSVLHGNAIPPSESPPLEALTFGRFSLDARARQLLKDGEVVPLQTKVFDTLLVLVQHRDRVVSKDELLHAIWPDSFVSEDSLIQNISALRRVFGDHSNQPRFIATMARHGFRTSVLEPFSGARNHFAVTGDGQRFLVSSVDTGRAPEPITVLSNWMPLATR